jgi:hypothetical protein
MRKILFAVMLVFAFAIPCFSAEQGEGGNISAEKGETSDAVQAVAEAALAEKLAETGRAQKSPLLLASAAQILGGAGAFAEGKEAGAEDAAVTVSKPANAGPAEKKSVSNTPESLYSEAIALAKEKNDEAMAGVIESLSRVGAGRGRVSGASANFGTVRNCVYYEWQFVANRRAIIEVLGDGDDIDLFVFDGKGNLIAVDDDYSTVCVVEFTPRRTEKFRVELRNASRASYIDYCIRTN